MEGLGIRGGTRGAVTPCVTACPARAPAQSGHAGKEVVPLRTWPDGGVPVHGGRAGGCRDG